MLRIEGALSGTQPAPHHCHSRYEQGTLNALFRWRKKNVSKHNRLQNPPHRPIRRRGIADRCVAGVGAGPHGGGAGDFTGDRVCLHRIAAKDRAFLEGPVRRAPGDAKVMTPTRRRLSTYQHDSTCLARHSEKSEIDAKNAFRGGNCTWQVGQPVTKVRKFSVLRAVMSETIGERHASACRYKSEVPEG